MNMKVRLARIARRVFSPNAMLAFGLLFCLSAVTLHAKAVGSQVDTNGTLATGLVSYYKMEGNSTDYFGSNSGTDTSMTYPTSSVKVGTYGAYFSGSKDVDDYQYLWSE